MKGKVGAAPRESRSFTVLLVLQLILVAVLVAVQYPALLSRAAARLSGKPRGLSRLKTRPSKVDPSLIAPAPASVPDTVWTPSCQLAEDKTPGHGPKVFVDVSVSSEFSARSRRDAIRVGYGKYAKTLGMRVRFFVGEADDEHGDTARGAEAREHGDLVVLRMKDTYENLTLKSMGMACVWMCGHWRSRVFFSFFWRGCRVSLAHSLFLQPRLFFPPPPPFSFSPQYVH